MSIHNGVMNAGHSLWNLLSKVRVISFNKAGYDPFIDFLKAYSIICVIITHAIPSKYWGYTMLMIWGDMQVPMFVLLQTFHAYKKGVKPSVNLQKLFRRIIHPFIWMQLFIFVCGVARCYLSDSLTIRQELEDTIVWGGKGPGSYFPWVYVQIAFLLPFVWRFFQKFTMAQLLLPFIVVCIAFDVLFSYINLPENIYSLLSVRYFFLIYLGMIWVKDGVRMNIKTFALSVVTIGLTLFFFYTNMNLEPFFFSTGWVIHRWICYFYVGSLLPFVLWYLYKGLSNYMWMNTVLKEIARSSYEIFLVQMAVFALLPPLIGHFIVNINIRLMVLIPMEIILSVSFGMLFRRMINLK